jgi:cytochrome c oxidase subunit IV
MADAAEGQQHPIKLYLIIWGWLFVLSFFSYMVDFMQVEGFWRWFLVLVFMTAKAGLIMAIFMHMKWERMSLVTAIVVPPTALLVLVFFLAIEGDYIEFLRMFWFS